MAREASAAADTRALVPEDLTIDAGPGALQTDVTRGAWTDPTNYIAEPDWEPGDATLVLEVMTHGGSVAQITIMVSPHDDESGEDVHNFFGSPNPIRIYGVPYVAACAELTPGNLRALAARMLEIADTVEPEGTF